jgi:lysylphosphatidylglycerol synthetase-like protein (DUF2156 family)
MKIINASISLTLGVLGIVFYFEIFNLLVKTPGVGWVFTDVTIRITIIACLAFAIFTFSRLFIKKLSALLLLFISILIGFLISFIHPIYIDDYGVAQKKEFKLKQDFISERIPDSGTYVVAFFTTNCSFCKAASYSFSINASKGNQPNTLIFFPGTKEDSDRFMEVTKAKFEYTLISDKKEFIENAGTSFPSVYLIKDGKVINHWVGSEINYSVLDYLASLS